MWNDIRLALRTARRSPGFTLVAVLSLTLGIGANTAIFSLLYQVAFRPLPVKDPGTLVSLESDDTNYGWTRRDNNWPVFSYPMLKAIRDGNRVFTGLAGRSSFPATLSYGGESVRAAAEVIAGDYFGVLGLRPYLGRLLTAQDEASEAPVIVLGYDYWANRLGRNPNIVSGRILLNSHPVVVAGIAPRDFRGLLAGQTPDLFAPASMMPVISPDWKHNGEVDAYWLNLVGRLKPGVDARQANAALGPLFRAVLADHVPQMTDLSAEHRKTMLAKPLRVQPAAQGLNRLRKDWQSPLLVLLVMVGLLLLIACANIAGLLLVRAVARQRELALRFALGASRWQVARQLLAESLMLALAGGLLGLFISETLTDGLLKLLPADVAGGWLAPHADLRVLGFSLAAATLTGVLFALAPALRAVSPDLAGALRQQSSGLTLAGHSSRTRQAFVAAQICLSLLLLVGAGLFTRSLLNLISTDPGFRPDRLVTFSIDPGLSGYSRERALALFRDLDSRLSALPQIRSVSRAAMQPFGGWNWGVAVRLPGSARDAGKSYSCGGNAVGAGYFRNLGTALVGGREFTPDDTRNAPRAAILNETFARQLFPGENPIGRHILLMANKTDTEIVGVVKDSKYDDLRETVRPFIYVPYEQAIDEFTRQSAYFLRTQLDERSVMPAVRAIMKQVDADIPIEHLTTMRVMLDDSIFQERMIATLAIAFGVLATILAAIGLYGTMSYSTACRTREFGIRLALGANPRMLLALVVREAAALIVIGVAAGLPLSYALARVVRSQFYGVTAHDAATLIGAALLIAAVGAAAALAPALRSMRISPLRALRYE